METAKQLSVTLANKPGRLAAMLGEFSKRKVTLRALAVMDSGDRGTLRFVPADVEHAVDSLQKMNVRFDLADVLLVEVPSQPGAFRNICEKLAVDHLNIDYAYCSFSLRGTKGGVLAIIRVNDLAKAQRVLGETGATTKARRSVARRPVYAR
jgi:hypothetical protein